MDNFSSLDNLKSASTISLLKKKYFESNFRSVRFVRRYFVTRDANIWSSVGTRFRSTSRFFTVLKFRAACFPKQWTRLGMRVTNGHMDSCQRCEVRAILCWTEKQNKKKREREWVSESEVESDTYLWMATLDVPLDLKSVEVSYNIAPQFDRKGQVLHRFRVSFENA
jgi:hypothetical protein